MGELGRPRLVLGLLITMAGFASLSTILLITGVIDGTDQGPFRGARPVDLESAEGVIGGLGLSASFLSIVALVFVAWKVAVEFADGTIRNLVIRQPQRGRLAAGKVAALCTLLIVGVLVATAASVLWAFLLAPTTTSTPQPGPTRAACRRSRAGRST